MITETTAMQTTAIYSDDKTHRYLLRKEWNSEKKSAEIIMLYPSSADTVTVDHTSGAFPLDARNSSEYSNLSV